MNIFPTGLRSRRRKRCRSLCGLYRNRGLEGNNPQDRLRL